MKGLVEGFYGRPYSKSQRETLLRYMTVLPDPAYLYAPKNDPYHRLRWREGYPREAWDGLASTMSLSRSLGVRFIFGISPWGFLPDDGPVLRERAQAAMDSGATGVAVLFDDIPEQADGELARAQIRLVTEALGDLSPVPILCPSVYCVELIGLLDGERYLDHWRESSPDGWPVIWTGDAVISPEIDRRTMATAGELLGRTPVLWDNLLADDYSLRRIFLGDPSGRMPESVDYLLNPSEIFPVALHGLHRMISAEGGGEWPTELGDPDAWKILEGFHNVPWYPMDWAGDLIEDIGKAVFDGPCSGLLGRLDAMIGTLRSFTEDLWSIEGGFGLMPYTVDLCKFLFWWRTVLRLPDAGSRLQELDRLMLHRLPYEHPLALMTGRLAGHRSSTPEGESDEG